VMAKARLAAWPPAPSQPIHVTRLLDCLDYSYATEPHTGGVAQASESTVMA
jgi:hypothetical protein